MALVTGSFVEAGLDTLGCHGRIGCDVDDVLSECSTTSGGNDNVHSDTGSDDGEVETVTFFDWDDTLFPTSWVQRQGLLPANEMRCEDRLALQTLASGVERVLRLALQFGKVVIVTNAKKGWVEMCCAEMMPSLVKVLQEVDIVSARSEYESCTNSPSEWKRLAFDREMQLLDVSGASQYNIISLGDSLYEQCAVMSLCEKMDNCFGKSLKFLDNPTIEELIDQHEFVASCFLDVAQHNGNLDVEIAL